MSLLLVGAWLPSGLAVASLHSMGINLADGGTLANCSHQRYAQNELQDDLAGSMLVGCFISIQVSTHSVMLTMATCYLHTNSCLAA